VSDEETRDDGLLQSGGALKGRLWQELEQDLAGGEPAPPGARVGPYQVVRELGRGGMGTVYLAERADGQFQQRVAIKVLRPDMASDDILQRFDQERRILASLQHAAIARLFDGGTTDDGRPYFVMEYADGVPIDAHCDARSLPVEDRLRLFLRVGEAVQHAHRNLVVHRDLKPSNILVSADGEVKLLDFGIAKVLEGAPDRPSAARTTVRVMTPEYASPEQVRGDPVTTASDVYQLGLLLYEMLTGRRPHAAHERTIVDLVRAISETAPAAPSTVASTDRLRRRLSGDLDMIVLMALRKEPDRRYATAHDMVEDVRRHLTGWPVRARPDTVRYRTGKFLRRHRLAAGAAALVVVSLAAGLSATAWQAARARRAAARAEAVTEFLVRVFELTSSDDPRSEQATVRSVLDRGVQRLDADLADQPGLRASLLGVMGRVYASLGLYDPAAALLEKTLALHRQQQRGDDLETARVLSDLAGVRGSQGDYVRATALARESLAMQTRLHPGDHRDVADTMDRLARSLSDQGPSPEVEPLVRESLAMRRRLYGNVHRDVVGSLNHLGTLLYERGDYPGAEASYAEALAIARGLPVDVDSSVPQSMANLASAVSKRGRTGEAVPLLQEAVRLFRRRLGDTHPELAPFLRNLGTALKADGRLQEATDVYRQVLDIERTALGPEHHEVAKTTYDLAAVLHDQGRLDEAVADYRRCVAILQKLLPPPHPHHGRAMNGRGRALNDRGDHAEAEALLRQALPILTAALPPGHDLIAAAQDGLGHALVGQGRKLAEAEDLLGRARDAYRATFGPRDPRTAEAQVHLAACLAARGQRPKARALLEDSLPVLVRAYGDADRRTRQARLLFASR
jgi:serine/threonine-protein kinase